MTNAGWGNNLRITLYFIQFPDCVHDTGETFKSVLKKIKFHWEVIYGFATDVWTY